MESKFNSIKLEGTINQLNSAIHQIGNDDSNDSNQKNRITMNSDNNIIKSNGDQQMNEEKLEDKMVQGNKNTYEKEHTPSEIQPNHAHKEQTTIDHKNDKVKYHDKEDNKTGLEIDKIAQKVDIYNKVMSPSNLEGKTGVQKTGIYIRAIEELLKCRGEIAKSEAAASHTSINLMKLTIKRGDQLTYIQDIVTGLAKESNTKTETDKQNYIVKNLRNIYGSVINDFLLPELKDMSVTSRKILVNSPEDLKKKELYIEEHIEYLIKDISDNKDRFTESYSEAIKELKTSNKEDIGEVNISFESIREILYMYENFNNIVYNCPENEEEKNAYARKKLGEAIDSLESGVQLGDIMGLSAISFQRGNVDEGVENITEYLKTLDEKGFNVLEKLNPDRFILGDSNEQNERSMSKYKKNMINEFAHELKKLGEDKKRYKRNEKSAKDSTEHILGKAVSEYQKKSEIVSGEISGLLENAGIEDIAAAMKKNHDRLDLNKGKTNIAYAQIINEQCNKISIVKKYVLKNEDAANSYRETDKQINNMLENKSEVKGYIAQEEKKTN